MAKFRLQAPSGFVYETDSAAVANDLVVDKGYKNLDLTQPTKARKALRRRATILTDKPSDDEVARAESEGMPSTDASPVADN